MYRIASNTRLYLESIIEYCQTEAEATRLNFILEEVSGRAPCTAEAIDCLVQDYGGNFRKLEAAAYGQAALADDALHDLIEHGCAVGLSFFARPLNCFRTLAQRADSSRDFCAFVESYCGERIALLEKGKPAKPVSVDTLVENYTLKKKRENRQRS